MYSPTSENVRQARDAAGLTQTQAAALIGASLRSWQEWEQGKTKMHPGLWRLFRHLAGIERIPYRAAAVRGGDCG